MENTNIIERFSYKAKRKWTQTIYGEKALQCPQFPFESCPKDNKWWEMYKRNAPYRQRAIETDNRIIRMLSLFGAYTTIRRLYRK